MRFMANTENVDSGKGQELLELDARGLYCPEPVMLLHNRIRDMAAGGVLRIIATDPSTTRDIPKFCHYLGHELIEQTQDDGLFCYLIRKNAS